MDTNKCNIPVFAFPGTLKFYLNARQTHKQCLTLYNPYEFPVRFKVLCTAPNKYSVIDPEGSIGPTACVDLVIRHTMPISANCNVLDKFRISLQDHTTRQILGKRDIESKLFNSEPDNISNDGDNFQSLPHVDKGPEDNKFPLSNMRTQSNHNSNKLIAIIAGLVSMCALLLPTYLLDSHETSVIPIHFHLSVNLKLVFAYLLGIVTMVVFIRP